MAQNGARYALYLAPPPESGLWQMGSALLGYDAASGEAVAQPVIHGVDPAAWRAFTEKPRLYGFHATIKAPFALHDDAQPEELCAALDSFCAAQSAFDLPDLTLTLVDAREGAGFLALVPEAQSAALAQFEREVVTVFDPFRAEVNDADRARRDPLRLTKRQRAYLERYGYPYVLEEFRLHFSLTDRIAAADPVAEAVSLAIRNRLDPLRFRLDALVLFEQTAPGLPFRIMRRFGLGG
jgi:hypothetical protein